MGARRWILVAAAVWVGVVASSATAEAVGWHFGGRVGAAMFGLRGDFADLADPDWRLSPTAGVFGEAEFVPTLAVRIEALYVQKGASFVLEAVDEGGAVVGTFDADLKLTYVEVPILLRVGLPDGGFASPYAIAGPTLGFGVEAKQDNPVGPDADLTDDLQRLDVGVTGGVGVRIGAPFGRVDLEARYATGLSDVWDISGNLESINQGFLLTVAWSR